MSRSSSDCFDYTEEDIVGADFDYLRNPTVKGSNRLIQYR